ncbi:MAG: addiction module protein [Desulfamplus sp.]|nr:addiction module protein [Desulfamplus sp.]
MKVEDIRQEVSRLGLAEKLLLVEDVWDSIALTNAEFPLPDWQKCELDKRYEDYKAGESNYNDWKSVHEGLRNKKIDEDCLFS